MVNILLEGYDISADWLRGELRRYIRPEQRVAIVAFSFRDSRVKNNDDWKCLYGREEGRYYSGMVRGFTDYGIAEENIRFVNYFADSHEAARRAVEEADIVYFPGGLPDRMLERIDEFELRDSLAHHKGIVMGYSAGAVIQLEGYHLSPDEDYPKFGYYSGLGYLDGFYLEVHYDGAQEQDDAIRRVLRERNRPVYATESGAGAIIVEDGNIKLLGKVHKYIP